MTVRWLSVAAALLVGTGAAASLAGQEERSGPGVPVVGTVLDIRSGTAVPVASIRLIRDGEDRAHREATSARTGSFNLGTVPAGSYRIEASALGYRPVSESVEILALGAVELRIELVPEALELDPIVVTRASGGRLLRTGFHERRQTGLGTYLTREEVLQRANTGILSDVFRTLPGTRVVPTPFGQSPRVQLRGGCEPSVFVDGLRLMSGTTVDEVLVAYDVEAMEVYRGSTAPAQFAGRGSSCGAIVVWTREPGRASGGDGFLPSFGRAFFGLGTILAIVVIGL